MVNSDPILSSFLIPFSPSTEISSFTAEFQPKGQLLDKPKGEKIGARSNSCSILENFILGRGLTHSSQLLVIFDRFWFLLLFIFIAIGALFGEQ